MKKALAIALVACTAAVTALFTGCEPSETLLTTAANPAGNLGLSAWFAIDNPDCDVKAALKDVVSAIDKGAAHVGTGGTYTEALTPVIQDSIAKIGKLTAAQKNLVNIGASVMLSALDTFVETHTQIKADAALVSKVVSAFCKGCLTAIERSDDCCIDRALKQAHANIKMKYDAKAKAFVVPKAK